MELWNNLSGMVRAELTCAEPEKMLSLFNQKGIILHDIRFTDMLTVSLTVSKQDYQVINQIATTKGAQVRVKKREGVYWRTASVFRRPILMIGMTLLLLLSLYLPSRIFFVRVTGNDVVPANQILMKAAECGIDFGASRREVRSEKVKNALLQAIPQLQWAGVNTSGCVAVISVREKAMPEKPEDQYAVCNIVAARDGVVRQCTVLQGTPLCAVGKAVKAGDILVSGYTDCGLLVKAVRANAEIFAETERKLEMIMPAASQRGEFLRAESSYYIQIGKNIINFCKDSGISDAVCVKMYEEKYVTLPGGFQIPIALVKETRYFYDMSEQQDETDEAQWLEKAAEDYLGTQMVAGKILRKKTDLQFEDAVCRLVGEYACLEMIGRVRSEEIIQKHE